MDGTRLKPREQGDVGERSAVEWLWSKGAAVFVPFGHSPDVDLIADFGDRALKIQVKTCTSRDGNRWHVAVCTRGGNQSWNRVTKHFCATRCDYLFVLVGDGRQWFIPSEAVGGTTCVMLGGPKYAQYEVEAGRPIPGFEGP